MWYAFSSFGPPLFEEWRLACFVDGGMECKKGREKKHVGKWEGRRAYLLVLWQSIID